MSYKYNIALTPQQNRIEEIIEDKKAKATDIPQMLRLMNDLSEFIKSIQHYSGTDYSAHIVTNYDDLIKSIEDR